MSDIESEYIDESVTEASTSRISSRTTPTEIREDVDAADQREANRDHEKETDSTDQTNPKAYGLNRPYRRTMRAKILHG